MDTEYKKQFCMKKNYIIELKKLFQLFELSIIDFEEDIQKEKRLNRIQGMTKKQISESDAMYNLKNKPVYGKPPSQLKQGR